MAWGKHAWDEEVDVSPRNLAALHWAHLSRIGEFPGRFSAWDDLPSGDREALVEAMRAFMNDVGI